MLLSRSARWSRAIAVALLVLSACTDAATNVTTDPGNEPWSRTGPAAAVATDGPSAAAAANVSVAVFPTAIVVGMSATITWNATGASSCQGSVSPASGGGAWGGTLPTSNNTGVSVTPTATGAFWYTVSCTGAGGGGSASARLIVESPRQPVVSLTAGNQSPVAGDAIVLSWTSSWAMSCTASGAWSGSKPANGSESVVVASAGSHTYSLSCAGPQHTTVASVTVTATPASPTLPTVDLALSPVQIVLGQTATLTWSTTNASSCQASTSPPSGGGSWGGSVATSNSAGFSVTPTAVGSFWYTLACTGSSTARDSAQLTVAAASGGPAPTVSLNVSPASINLGQSATLQWNTTNATSCQASASTTTAGSWSGSKPVGSSSATVTPTAIGSVTYSLTCSGGGGNDTATARLPVHAPPPTINLTANPLSAPVGNSVLLSWSTTYAGSCVAGGAWSGSKAITGNQSVVVANAGNNIYTITCSGPQYSSVASVTVTGTSGGGPFTTQFTPNQVTISTSEGAPYGDNDFWIMHHYAQTKYGYGPTKVIRLYICLSGMVTVESCSSAPTPTGPLSQGMLNAISAGIASYAGTGVRLLVRFIYNYGPIGPGARDVPASLIVTHIDQLAPILLQHRDLILALQAGFIGTWGEWHNSTSGNTTTAARKQVLDREALHFRGVFPIMVRYPADLLTYLNSSTPSPDFGLQNDYFASNADDGATWWARDGHSVSQLQSYTAAVSTSSIFGGEFGELSPSQQTCSALDSYAYTYKPQTFSLHIYPSSIGDYLQSQGCVLSFFNRVGTRIEARSLTVTGNAAPGATLQFSLTLVNAGFGRVIRARPATVVLTSPSGVVLQQTQLSLAQLDLRTLAAGAQPVQRVFNFSVTLPSSLPSGPVSVALLVRDPAPSLAALAAYALPFNSLDVNGQPMFDPATGLNRLGTITSGVIAAVTADAGFRRVAPLPLPRDQGGRAIRKY